MLSYYLYHIDNPLYLFKMALILGVVFSLLYFVMRLSINETTLLTIIIIACLFLIDQVINSSYENLNCTQCKISPKNEPFINTNQSNNNNIDIISGDKDSEKNVDKNVNKNVNKNVDSDDKNVPEKIPEEVSIKIPDENIKTFDKNSSKLDQVIDEQKQQINDFNQETINQENRIKFRMSVGDSNISQEYIRNGQDYYNKINSYSSSAPTADEALSNELKYGDYNYIGPANKGMTNKTYTFISPNNWYPVPPHPPVCVVNDSKKQIAIPIQITDGKDYMAWTSLEEFDNARRFTGNMGININYIQNVLNKDN